MYFCHTWAREKYSAIHPTTGRSVRSVKLDRDCLDKKEYVFSSNPRKKANMDKPNFDLIFFVIIIIVNIIDIITGIYHGLVRVELTRIQIRPSRKKRILIWIRNLASKYFRVPKLACFLHTLAYCLSKFLKQFLPKCSSSKSTLSNSSTEKS